MPAEIQIETVRTGAFTMDFFRFGQGRRPLVILPGLSVQSVMGASSAVAGAYRPLTEDFTIYVFDRRKELPASYPVEEMARDTAAALCALGLARVCLFGASQGGMLAMKIAAEQPALVERLALGSTAARVTEARGRVMDTWIRLAEDGDAQALYLAFGEALYPPALFAASRSLLCDAARGVTEADLRRFVILAKGTRGFDALADLGRIECPVLVIGAEDDRVLGADASREIAAQLRGRPDCTLYMYEGGGHAAYDTAPDYKERLRRFFAPEADG